MRFKSTRALVALVAVLAMSAVTAAAASAVKPEFKPVPAKKAFLVSAGTSKWVFGANSISCTSATAAGEIVNAQSVGNVVVKYSGCKSSGTTESNCPVNSTGAKAGQIVTLPLSGELGTVATSQAASGVGLSFKPENSSQEWFKTEGNKCTIGVAWLGGLAAEVSVIGKKQTTNGLVLKPASSFGTTGEKIKEITLDSGVFEEPVFEEYGTKASIETTDDWQFAEAVEVT